MGVRPAPPQGPGPWGTECSSQVLGTTEEPDSPQPPGRMLGLSPMSAGGSRAGLLARFCLRSARPGVGGRTPPSAPATHSRSRKTTGAGLPPASHPGGSPTSSTLAGEEGFMQRARARARGAESGPAGGGARRPVPPRAHSARDRSPESRGQLGRAEPCSCRRTAPPPRLARCFPSRALRLQHPEERGQPEGRAAKLQNSGSPRRPSLALAGFSRAFPCSGRTPGPPWLSSSTLCRTKRASLEQEKDDPLDPQPKAAVN